MGRTTSIASCGSFKSEQSIADDEWEATQHEACAVCDVDPEWCEGCQDMICKCSPCDCKE